MFRLAHLSDPHLGPMPDASFRDLVSKRVIGYVNWHRSRARSMTASWLDLLLDDLKAKSPDHVTVTGDLVNIALDMEISAARHWLDDLGRPDDLTVVPGNHDAYVPGALRRAVHAWGPYMTGDLPLQEGFPFIRRRGEVAAQVTSAVPLSEPEAASVTEALRKVVGQKVSVALTVDPSLIGGLIVRVGSRMIDSSLRTKLQRLQLAMKGIG